jgi:hypothetical protein
MRVGRVFVEFTFCETCEQASGNVFAREFLNQDGCSKNDLSGMFVPSQKQNTKPEEVKHEA